MSASTTSERTVGVPHRTIRLLEVTAWLAHHRIPHPHTNMPHPHIPHLHVPHPHLPTPRPHYDSHDGFMEESMLAREMERL